MNQSFEKRLFGRVVAKDVKDEQGNVIVKKNEGIDEQQAEQIANIASIDEVYCRTVVQCKLVRGVCRLCYGFDLGFNRMVNLGAAVGIVAAQAIGEPGTQLTMRTFHTGGSASVSDITQGLPRVEELFEAREPKGMAFVAEVAGTVSIAKPSNKEVVVSIEGKDVKSDIVAIPAGSEVLIKDGAHVTVGDSLFSAKDGTLTKAQATGVVRISEGQIRLVHEGEELAEYIIPSSLRLLVADGDLVYAGQPLTEGNLSPNKILELQGTEAAQKYIVKEVQDIYVSQGQQIHDKHIEVIVRQMFSKMRITATSETDLVLGDVIDKSRMQEINEQLEKDGRELVQAEQLLMGITKISLSTESFLAAASFQETTRVLIEAAVTGKTDYLKGLKENVIIGKLIPAGTGFNPDVAEQSLKTQELPI